MIDISVNYKGLDVLSADTMARAILGTMRRLSAIARTEASKSIRQIYYIKKQNLDRHIKIIGVRMRGGQTIAGIRSRGLPLGASKFLLKAKQGVAYRRGETPSLPLDRDFVGIWKKGEERLWVMQRTTKKRHPRRSVLGPSTAEMLGDVKVKADVAMRVQEDAQKVFEQQLWRFITKEGK